MLLHSHVGAMTFSQEQFVKLKHGRVAGVGAHEYSCECGRSTGGRELGHGGSDREGRKKDITKPHLGAVRGIGKKLWSGKGRQKQKRVYHKAQVQRKCWQRELEQGWEETAK